MSARPFAHGLAKNLIAIAVGLAALSSAHAASQVFFANSTTALTPEQERDAFLLATTAVQTEGFESAPTGRPAGGLAVFNGAGRLTQGANARGNVLQGLPQNGRFNTTPGCNVLTACKWWETAFSFDMTLGEQKSALAFFATDLGDLGGSVSLDFWNDTNKVRSGIAVTQPTVTSGLLFFGFIDDTFTFNRVTVNVQQTNVNPTFFDGIGFDDVMAGVRAPSAGTVPEPASWALVAVSLGLLAGTRRAGNKATPAA